MPWIIEDAPPSTPPPSGRWIIEDAPPEPEPGLLKQAGRQLGLTARAAIKGAASLPNLLGNAVGGIYNAGADAIQGQGQGYRVPDFNDSFNSTLTAAGLPQPENSTERVVGDVGEALAGVAAGAGAGQAMQAGGRSAQALGNFLADNLPLQMKAAGAGAGAAGVTRENGGGAGAQTAAGLAAAVLAPSIKPAAGDAVKLLFRGGDKNLPKMLQNMADAVSATGDVGTVSQATKGTVARNVESLQANAPVSSFIMANKAKDIQKGFGERINNLADTLSPKMEDFKIGDKVSNAVQEGFVKGKKAVQSSLYDRFYNFMPKDTAVNVDGIKKTFSELNKEIPDAPELSKWFQNKSLKNLELSLQSDTASNPGGVMLSSKKNPYQPFAKPKVEAVLPPIPKEGLPLEAVKELRSLIGSKLENFDLNDEVHRSAYKALYASTSDAIENAAEKIGPQALNAFKRANDYSRGLYERVGQLSKFIKNDSLGENVYNAVFSGANKGPSRLRQIFQSVPDEVKSHLTSSFLRDLGTSIASKQNADGSKFSIDTFLTRWNHLPEESKKVIFHRQGYGEQFVKDLNAISRYADNVREGSEYLKNASGTGATLMTGLTAGSIATNLGSGNILAAVGSAAAIGGNALIAKKAMTNPKFVRFLATNLNKPSAAIPAQLNAFRNYANKSKDPDLVEISDYLDKSSQGQQ